MRQSRGTVRILLNGHLGVSPEQPILVAERGWVEAGALVVGNKVVTGSAGVEELEEIRRETGEWFFCDFRLTGDLHTYIADDVVCHNKLYK